MVAELLSKHAVCPTCRGNLISKSGHLHCGKCSTSYRDLNGVPWLFSHPESVWLDWRDRVQFQYEKTIKEIITIEQSAAQVESASARERLALLGEGMRHNANVLVDLLKPLLNTKKNLDVHEASRSQLALSIKLMGYYQNVPRDWVWGDQEFAIQDQEIRKLAGHQMKFGQTLILGAGAGRFANDFTRHCDVAVALDINPLLVAFGARLTAGKAIEYYEFPILPATSKDVAKRLTCKAQEPAGDKLVWLFGDGINPPFKEGSFDTVVTPWFIDVVSEDLGKLAGRINHLLKPNGRWLNFGPCSFLQSPWAMQRPPNEVLETVIAQGFKSLGESRSNQPYLNSPHSGQQRQEAVLTFLLEKVKSVAAAPPYRQFPEWLEDLEKPIPVGTKLEHYQKIINIQEQVLKEIDGKSSIMEIAAKFAPKFGLSQEDAAGSVSKLLRRLLSDI